jgi:hypothetical protein
MNIENVMQWDAEIENFKVLAKLRDNFHAELKNYFTVKGGC